MALASYWQEIYLVYIAASIVINDHRTFARFATGKGPWDTGSWKYQLHYLLAANGPQELELLNESFSKNFFIFVSSSYSSSSARGHHHLITRRDQALSFLTGYRQQVSFSLSYSLSLSLILCLLIYHFILVYLYHFILFYLSIILS